MPKGLAQGTGVAATKIGGQELQCRGVFGPGLDEIFADFARHLADLAEFGSLGRTWVVSLQLLEACAQQLEPDIISLNAAIGASEGDAAWEFALTLMSTIFWRRLSPSRITFNSSIRACGTAQWTMAILLLRSMGGQQPDALSFNTAIAAAPWPIALQLLTEMETACLRASLATAHPQLSELRHDMWNKFYDVEEPDIFHNIQVAKDGGFSDHPAAHMTEEGIYWHNLSVSVNGQTLVQPHSGCARSGRLLALMGPSGAGKSLLLHSLAALAPANARVLGSVYWNDVAEVGVPQRNMALLEQDHARRQGAATDGAY
eukprot:g6982.t1